MRAAKNTLLGLAQVNMARVRTRDGGRAAGRGAQREAAAVAAQVQHAPARRQAPDLGTVRALIWGWGLGVSYCTRPCA